MRRALILVLFLASCAGYQPPPKTSTFKRLGMPMGMAWVNQNQQPISIQSELIVPDNGRFTLDYQKLYPADYASKTIPVAPMIVDLTDPQAPIYDVDESYDHITIQADSGHRIRWKISIAVPRRENLQGVPK